ncbi:MAG: peptidoglycan-binding protein [Erysipelotrichaceae bacterium]|nr:peptidoglycan-binding protein [Erysipelotrichaceae bacterium]
MKINVHAGHNPDGKVASGAGGIVKESTEARKIKDEVINQLRALGHTVYDCTVDNGTGQSDVLNKIVTKCNAHTVDLDVSIHLNAGSASANGTEVLLYSAGDFKVKTANAILENFEKLGYKSRGIKYRTDLYYLRKSNAPAMLIECFFCTNADDVVRYTPADIAGAIVVGIVGANTQVVEKTPVASENTAKTETVASIPKVSAFTKVIQNTLNVLGYGTLKVDGIDGPLTQSAIKKFQADMKLPETGLVDAKTRAAIDEIMARHLITAETADRFPYATRYIQKRVGTAIDGKFGVMTLMAVKNYQTAHDLGRDGKVGAKTWAAIL